MEGARENPLTLRILLPSRPSVDGEWRGERRWTEEEEEEDQWGQQQSNLSLDEENSYGTQLWLTFLSQMIKFDTAVSTATSLLRRVDLPRKRRLFRRRRVGILLNIGTTYFGKPYRLTLTEKQTNSCQLGMEGDMKYRGNEKAKRKTANNSRIEPIIQHINASINLSLD